MFPWFNEYIFFSVVPAHKVVNRFSKKNYSKPNNLQKNGSSKDRHFVIIKILLKKKVFVIRFIRWNFLTCFVLISLIAHLFKILIINGKRKKSKSWPKLGQDIYHVQDMFVIHALIDWFMSLLLSHLTFMISWIIFLFSDIISCNLLSHEEKKMPHVMAIFFGTFEKKNN